MTPKEQNQLIELDKQGYFPATGETLPDFLLRVQTLQQHTEKFLRELKQAGQITVEGISFLRKQQIPASLFLEANELTAPFQFQISWVPGFFQTPDGGWLFGGCAYTFPPSNFSIFQIQEKFRKQKRWLCYRRQELLAHELCHVARGPLNSTVFEEIFAYKTATSSFRRLLGGIFQSQWESLLFLGTALLIPIGQFLHTFLWQNYLFRFFCLPFSLFLLYLLLRHFRLLHILKRAREKLMHLFGKNADAVLFRCTDAEIFSLAKKQKPDSWLKERKEELRWQLFTIRFGNPGK